MEWLVGESPTDLLMMSSEDSVVHQSTPGEGCQSEAKQRLLDLVHLVLFFNHSLLHFEQDSSLILIVMLLSIYQGA